MGLASLRRAGGADGGVTGPVPRQTASMGASDAGKRNRDFGPFDSSRVKQSRTQRTNERFNKGQRPDFVKTGRKRKVRLQVT